MPSIKRLRRHAIKYKNRIHVFKEFKKFLKDYRIIAVSAGFVVAIAASNFIQSFVNDILLPIFRPIITPTTATWEEMILPIGPVNIRIGSFLSSSMALLIILLVLYVFIAKLLKWKPKR